jgi:hypothetical protein
MRVSPTRYGDSEPPDREHPMTAGPLMTAHQMQAKTGAVGADDRILEIWPAQHYSPIHSHGHTPGIIHCLAGQLDVMAYDKLAWDAPKRGLFTLTPGQCAWLAGDTYAVHKVYCPMDGDNGPTGPQYLNNSSEFAASFHVYLNEDELSMDEYQAADLGRDKFHYIDELDRTEKVFTTYSDLSWNVLRRVLAETPLE